MGNTLGKTVNKQSIIDSQDGHHTGTDPNTTPTSSLNYDGMDEKVVNIVTDKVALDWKIFARGTGFNGVDAVIDQIDHDLTGEKSKIQTFLKKLYQQHPNGYRTCIQNSLNVMERNDVLQEITYLDKEEYKLEIRDALKMLYLANYGKIDQLVHIVKNPTKVELLNKFVELIAVNADEVEKDYVTTVKPESFLQKKMSYKPIDFEEVFSVERSLLLISGIAGVGKTWLLKKCLLDWANNILWQNVDLVIHLECRKLNQYQNISNLNELFNVFYNGIFKDCNILECFSILLVIDGLDEFAYLDEFIKHDPLNPSQHPIVNALADALDVNKHKCVVAGRVGAILQYKDKVTECADQLTIQIMGFNDDGINNYIEKFSHDKKTVKNVLESSSFAKAMASVPFNLSAMCTIIGTPILSDSFSFLSLTELYCCTFLYFLQKHINKNNEPVYKMMQSDCNKQFILRVCKVAWHMFNQGKVVFSQREIDEYVDGFEEHDQLGFIEKVESQLGYQYQFVHLTLMEFCASVHAHVHLSSKEIIENKRMYSCLPLICGLTNENERSFVKFLPNVMNSNERRNSLLISVCDLIPKRGFDHAQKQQLKLIDCEDAEKLGEKLNEDAQKFQQIVNDFLQVTQELIECQNMVEEWHGFEDAQKLGQKLKEDAQKFGQTFNDFAQVLQDSTDAKNILKEWYYFDNRKIFMECFFEAQASVTEDLKRSIGEREWSISISEGKNAHEFSHEKYFLEKFLDTGFKLNRLEVPKKNLSEDEKNILIKCSTNVSWVHFTHPLKLDGRIPKDKIEWVVININETFVSKNEFESFLPWIRLANNIHLRFHDETNFIDDVCEWLCGSNLNMCWIEYRGKSFNNIEELKKLK